MKFQRFFISLTLLPVSCAALSLPVAAQSTNSSQVHTTQTGALDFSEVHYKIKTAVETKDRAGAINLLKTLHHGDAKLFTLNNYDYLLGRLLEDTGDTAGAASNYLSVVKRNSVLSEYALWRISSIMRASGNLGIERFYLDQLLAASSESFFSDAAQMRIAQSYFESSDFPAAIRFLHRVRFSAQRSSTPSLLPDLGTNSAMPGTLNGNDPRTREALVLLGRSYAQNGQGDQARQIFNKLCNSVPDPAMPDDFALSGARGLDELDRYGQSNAVPELAEPEHMKRAAIYQFNRDFQTARIHYQAVIDRFPRSANVPDAMYQTGRGLVQQLQFEEALPWLERVQLEFPTHKASLDALNQTAAIYGRSKRPNEAFSRYQKYIALDPNSETAKRAHLNIIELWRDESEFTKALEWTQKTEQQFAGTVTASLAIFSRAKTQMAQNNWEGALVSLDELKQQSDLGGVRIAGGTNKEEVAFLHAYVLEKLSRFAEAVNEYLAIPDGRNEYYGWRATERLRELSKNPAATGFITWHLNTFRGTAKQALERGDSEGTRRAAQNAFRLTADTAIASELLSTIRRTYVALPAYATPTGVLQNAGRQDLLKTKRRGDGANIHQVLADELLFLGLYDEGTPELELGLKQKNANLSPDMAYTLAVFYQRGEKPFRSTAYAEPLWRKVPDDLLPEAARRDTLQMLYPAPFTDALLTSSSPRSVDPRFLLSIMRQESRFRPDVKSNAAARGLMQFISSTADSMALKTGQEDFVQNDLYHPSTSVLFGAQYVKDLFEMFPDQPQAVAASYNGGEHNMIRWLRRAHSSDPDAYVSEIVFSQSKDYVYKVMNNYRMYRTLYNEELDPINLQ